MIASLQVGSISERFLCLCDIYIYMYIIFCLSGRYQYGNIYYSFGKFLNYLFKKSTRKHTVIHSCYSYVTYVLDT